MKAGKHEEQLAKRHSDQVYGSSMGLRQIGKDTVGDDVDSIEGDELLQAGQKMVG